MIVSTVTGAVSKGLGKIGGVIGSALSSGAGAAVSAAGRIGASIGNTLSGAIQTGVNAAGLAIAGLGATIAANLGGAVARADLLNNFPKVMGNIGFSSEEAAGQIQRISDSLDGLPTSTDALVATAKGLAPLTGDLTSATDVALALNNALLGGGASATLAENAMEQFRQMLSVGTVDMAAWRSLVSAMPGQMDQLSKSILGAEGNSSALYAAMKEGSVSFDDFNAALVALNTEGYDGLASFSEQAQTATAGIGTAMTNVGNRVKKAIATVIEAIGVDAISGKINELTSGITGWGAKIAEIITGLKDKGTEGIQGIIGPFAGLAPIIGGLLGMLGPLAVNIPYIGKAFSGLTGPVGLVIGLFVSAWQQSDILREAIGTAFETMGTIFEGFAPVVSALSTSFSMVAHVMGNSLGQAINMIMPTLLQLGNTIFPVLTQTINGLTPILVSLTATIGAALMNALSAVLPALMQMAQAIFPVLGQVIAALAPVFAQLVGLFAGIFAQVIQILAPILAQIAQVLMPVILQVVQALIPPITQVIAALMPVVQQVLPILGRILGTLVTVLGNIIAAVLPPLAAVLGTVISVLASLITTIAAGVLPVFNVFATVVDWAIKAVGAIFMWLWDNVVSLVLGKIGEKLTTFKDFIDVTVKPAVEKAVKAMGDGFTTFKDTVKTAMDKIKEVAAKPINFVINTVYRDGIKKAFDTIAEKIGLETRMPSVSSIPGYASGGVLPGYTPGRDVYHFTSHDGGGNLALSGGESIMVPEWTRAVGGKRAVKAMNDAARAGRALPLGDRGGWRGFADGGIWDKLTDTVAGGIDSVTSWVSGATDAIASIVSDPLGAVTNLIKKPVDALMGAMPGGGFPKDIASYLPKTIIDGIGSFLKEKATTISASDLVTQARLAIGTPYVWGGVSMPGGLDCSGLIVWALRQMGHNVPRHTAATFQANSVPVGSPVPGDLAFWGNPAHHVAIVSGPGMMVEAPTFGMTVRETPIYGGPTYGRFMYDDGGYLQPGLTMVENRTGKPEPVFTDSQWATLKENRAFPEQIIVRIGEREFHAYAADVADERIIYASREG
nr:tape measure protein [Actinomyces bowdenii]